FKGHPWTLIQHIHNDFGKDCLCPEDARDLSSELKTSGIYYGISDTACSVGYQFYDLGEEMESLDFSEDYSEFLDDEFKDDGEGEDYPVYFESKLRSVNVDEIDDPFEFVDRFLRSQDALVPGWSELTRCTGKPGQSFVIKDWPRDTFVRVDFVAVR
ncbi:hypothetical protein ACFL2Q_15605, partial [Thermodesulfobacteriota bacterium]